MIPAELAERDPRVAEFAEFAASRIDELADHDGNVRDAARSGPWRPLDDRAAEWALRRWREASTRIARARDQAAAWHAEIDAWLADATRRDTATMEVMAAHLERYALERAEDGGPATLRLPSGSVPTRLEGPKAIIVDEDKFLAWAVEHLPDAVRVERRPLISAARQNVQLMDRETGRVDVELACGHLFTTPNPVEIGEQVLCPVCSETVDVTAVSAETRLVPVVVSPDGMVVDVPGLAVDPGGRKVLQIKPGNNDDGIE